MVEAKFLHKPERFDRVDRVKEVVGEPVLPGDDRLWILGDPLVAEVDGRDHIEVPVGFTTDGASVPGIARWLTSWGPWEEPQRSAAIVHDWLYTQSGVAKAYADDVFEALLKAGGTSWLKRRAMYLAVKLGGGPAYRHDQAEGPHIYRK